MPKLADFCPDARHLFSDYFQIGPTEYARTSHEWKDGGFTDTLVIDSVYWAPTLTAFRRLAIRDADILATDDDSTLPLPDALRLAPHCTAYGAIQRFVVDSDIRSHELDLYDTERRWTADGKGWRSIGSCFSVPRFTYYFRSALPVPAGERPYAAHYDTRDDETIKRMWTPCGHTA